MEQKNLPVFSTRTIELFDAEKSKPEINELVMIGGKFVYWRGSNWTDEYGLPLIYAPKWWAKIVY